MTGRGRLFVLSLGTLFIAFGTLMLTLNLRVIAKGIRTEGVVTGYESRRQSARGAGGHTDAPVVEFYYDGETLRIPAQMSSAWHGYKQGDRVILYFDPADRREVILDSLYQRYGYGTLFILCGLLQCAVVWVIDREKRTSG